MKNSVYLKFERKNFIQQYFFVKKWRNSLKRDEILLKQQKKIDEINSFEYLGEIIWELSGFNTTLTSLHMPRKSPKKPFMV